MMSGINSGILQNASPLSAEAIKELERQVLETGKAYAYLDQNSKLCFAMPHGVNGIKELAWNSAYELSRENGTLTKKAYKKTGLKTFSLDKVLSKQNINDSWVDTTGSAERLEGDGQEFYTAAPSALSFRSTAPLNEFQEVQINGQTIDPSNYTLEEGSTIVKFSIDYLNTLDAGTHSVTIVSKNKTASGQFNVQQPKVNEYGFCYNTPYAIPAEMASVVESHACVILTDKQLAWLDEPLPLAVVCVNNAYRGFGLYRIDGQTLNLVTFDDMFNLSVQVISPYELLVGMDVDGEQQQLPMAINGDPVYYASDGAHLYVLNGDEESYAASSVGLAMDKPYPILTGVNGLPTTAVSSRGYEGVAYPGCLEIPNTVTEIGEKAFAGLSAAVHIPNSVEFIGHATFLEYLSVIYIDSLEHWCGINFDGQPILGGARIYLNDNPVDGELVIPDSVSVISPGAFVDYNPITSIVLPATTARLTNAFGGSNLQTIVYKGTVAQWNALPKDEDWHGSIFMAKYVQCSDGQVAI